MYQERSIQKRRLKNRYKRTKFYQIKWVKGVVFC